jgi:hypothetical protein
MKAKGGWADRIGQLRAATVAVDVARAATVEVEVEVEVAFEGIPVRWRRVARD